MLNTGSHVILTDIFLLIFYRFNRYLGLEQNTKTTLHINLGKGKQQACIFTID